VRELLDGNYGDAGPDRRPGEGAARFSGNSTGSALPVTDENRKLIGIVTVDDMLDVADGGGHRGHPEARRYRGPRRSPTRRSPCSRMVKKRASWLVVLFLGRNADGDGDELLSKTKSPRPWSSRSSCRWSSAPAAMPDRRRRRW